ERTVGWLNRFRRLRKDYEQRLNIAEGFVLFVHDPFDAQSLNSLIGFCKHALIPNDHELTGLLMAFELYATGKFSDNEVARALNERGYCTKAGKLFSTDMVRDMLQNRTYLGYVKYQ